jgi:uncharacterized protein
MPIVQQSRAGRPVWAELGTTNPDAVSKFYETLFGWTRYEVFQGGNAAYWMWHKNGLDVAGMYHLAPPLTDQGIPPHWLLYFGTEDAEVSAARARESQGGVLFGPMDVGEAGRSAWLVDQHGAMFAVWQAKGHIGFGLERESGALCWAELVTPSFDRSIAFYGHLFGWSYVERSPDTRRGPAKYLEWMTGDGPASQDEPFGGALEMTAAWKGIPPHWMPYFQVDDLDAALSVVASCGGSVAYGPISMTGVGNLAMVADPAGVHLSIIEPEVDSCT